LIECRALAQPEQDLAMAKIFQQRRNVAGIDQKED
jgi:hypothetical protein